MVASTNEKHVAEYQYVIKYILPKCICLFTVYCDLVHVSGTYYTYLLLRLLLV
jgi:hypothetical protein